MNDRVKRSIEELRTLASVADKFGGGVSPEAVRDIANDLAAIEPIRDSRDPREQVKALITFYETNNWDWSLPAEYILAMANLGWPPPKGWVYRKASPRGGPAPQEPQSEKI